MIFYFNGGLDLGNGWPVWGHAILAAICALGAWFAASHFWRASGAFLALVALWATAGAAISHLAFHVASVPPMPAANFMSRGEGRALDLGCGSGRATIMLARARPAVAISALDSLGAGTARLRANLRAAGIDRRVEIVTADMRRIHSADDAYEGVVSAYAIDGLDRDGIRETLHEVARVMKPGGEFLLIIARADAWMRFVYGLLPKFRQVPAGFWPQALGEAGLSISEQGAGPGTAWFLCRNRK